MAAGQRCRNERGEARSGGRRIRRSRFHRARPCARSAQSLQSAPHATDPSAPPHPAALPTTNARHTAHPPQSTRASHQSPRPSAPHALRRAACAHRHPCSSRAQAARSPRASPARPPRCRSCRPSAHHRACRGVGQPCGSRHPGRGTESSARRGRARCRA